MALFFKRKFSLWLLLNLPVWCITACQPTNSLENTIKYSLFSATGTKAKLAQRLEEPPFSVQCRVLPASNVDLAYNTDFTAKGNSTPDSRQALTFHLQIQAVDPSRGVMELITEAAPPGTTPEQIQQELLYRFEGAGHLVVGKESISAVSATVEMTADAAQTLSIVFVFPVVASQMREASSLALVIDKAFFLPVPLTFSFDPSAVVAAQQQ